MLSVVKVIGACLVTLLAVYGLIAIVLMLLIRVKDLFNPAKEYWPTRRGTKIGFRAIVTDAKTGPGRFLLGLGIVCAIAFFPQYVLFGLIALGAVAALLSPIAKWRGWGSEGRLTRHLSRPPFMDESHRAVHDSTKSIGGSHVG